MAIDSSSDSTSNLILRNRTEKAAVATARADEVSDLTCNFDHKASNALTCRPVPDGTAGDDNTSDDTFSDYTASDDAASSISAGSSCPPTSKLHAVTYTKTLFGPAQCSRRDKPSYLYYCDCCDEPVDDLDIHLLGPLSMVRIEGVQYIVEPLEYESASDYSSTADESDSPSEDGDEDEDEKLLSG